MKGKERERKKWKGSRERNRMEKVLDESNGLGN